MICGFFIVGMQSVSLILTGIALLGFSAPFAILPLFPLMSNSVNKEDPEAEIILTYISGIYNAALGIGAIFGPLIGSYLFYYFGFLYTAYFLGILWMLLSAILLLTGPWSKETSISDKNWTEIDVELQKYKGKQENKSEFFDSLKVSLKCSISASN